MATIRKGQKADGTTIYNVQIRMKGHPHQSATFYRLTDARRWIQDTESAIRDGRHFPTKTARRHTFQEAFERYSAQILAHKADGTQRRQRTQLEWWRERLAPYTLAQITPERISEHKAELMAAPSPRGGTLSPATVNRYLAILSHVLAVASREWGWIESNPLEKVSNAKEPRGRVRFLSDGERARLLTACQMSPTRHLYPIVIMALTTGMRHSEILGLRWGDVDLERRRLTLQETKNGERRGIPLPAPTLEVLRAHGAVRRLDTDLVFPGIRRPTQPANIRKAWESALREAEIEDFRFHDLRHSAASYLAMSGATLAEIAEILGHKTLAMVKRYAHLTEGHTASVVERMAEKYI